MLAWYLAVLLLAARLRAVAIWERLTAPVEPARITLDPANPTALLASYRRTAEGVVVGRHRPEYVATFA